MMKPVAHVKSFTIPDDDFAVATKTEAPLSRLPQGPEGIAEFAHFVDAGIPSVLTDFVVAFDGGDFEFLVDDERSRFGRVVSSSSAVGGFV